MTGLDLAFDETQEAIADAVGRFAQDHWSAEAARAAEGRFPADLWKGLAELGVLSLGTPEGDGGVVELVAAAEALGRAAFPGPLGETWLAAQLLPEAERRALAGAERIASVGTPPVLPWAPVAQLFVELAGDRAYRAHPEGAIEAIETLGGEPWGRVALARDAELEGLPRALDVHAVALAAYLAAAGRRLVDDTAEHARTRKQFGRPIGEFQAVAHPLADAAISLDGAATLARAAAFRLATGAARAEVSAAAARIAACRSALHAAHLAHQLFGAVGITREGPVFHISRRIVQLASGSPGEARARRLVLGRFGIRE